jgi:hypothetical protein
VYICGAATSDSAPFFTPPTMPTTSRGPVLL